LPSHLATALSKDNIAAMELAPKGSIEATIADAPPQNWVDTKAPAITRPYLRLARADRPIGTWLLLIPCWWGLALAAPLAGSPFPNLKYMALFAIGALVMRAAGCTFNDIVDQDIDAQVERTKQRPLPSGAVTSRQAWIFLFTLLSVGLAILLTLNTFTVAIGCASLGLVAIYPFMKRITYWPQVFLGLTFNWGVLMGWSAITQSLGWPPVALYLAGVAWTIGYDTIYAHQDKDDDILIGVKSTALKFGDRTRVWLSVFYAAAAIMITISGSLAALGWGFFAVLALGIIHLAHQITSLEIDNPQNCLTHFKSNRDFGLIILAAIVAGNLTA
jgi:4-hydroxybenzoate polyprenyltransferase